MKHQFTKTIVIALGGSIIYPEEIDIKYLKQFKKFIETSIQRGTKFVIVIGGGRLARVFQNVAHEISPLTDEDKDWIGIHSTRLNAHLLRTIFRKAADPVIIDERGKTKRSVFRPREGGDPQRSLKYPVTIASGWRPGWSTDFVAAAIAHDLKIPEYVVAGKPAFVYDKDPGVYKTAKPLPEIRWKNYRKLIPASWVPGFHSPVDPVAAKLSDSVGLKAIIINGKDLKNFERLLAGKDFQGTVISR